jgi:hypothetical protein
MSEFITVRIPRDHWDQIVSDIENMCGTHKDDIEILADAYVVEDAAKEAEDSYDDGFLESQYDDGPGTFEYDYWDYEG